MTAARTRVLVVDDSAFMRKLIPAILARDPEIDVAGTAMDGVFALEKVARLRPDVVTLDLDMPRMHGLEALRRLVEQHGVPVLVLSAYSQQGARLTLQALELGAVDFLAKPRGVNPGGLEALADELIHKVKMAARVSPRRLAGASPNAECGARNAECRSKNEAAPNPQSAIRNPQSEARAAATAQSVVAIGISTGGPQALSYLLPQLPHDYPAGILVVQHMPRGFTRMFADRLAQMAKLEVREARDGDLVLPGRVLVAPGDQHLTVSRKRLGAVAALGEGASVKRHRPSVDVLFASVAAAYGPRAAGLLMTGMGDDGADGLARIKAAGGTTLVQSEDSCVVAGMPRAALERGCVDRVVPLEDLAQALKDLYAGGGWWNGHDRG
jgi:two-component system chemotaxis response regulator CheB